MEKLDIDSNHLDTDFQAQIGFNVTSDPYKTNGLLLYGNLKIEQMSLAPDGTCNVTFKVTLTQWHLDDNDGRRDLDLKISYGFPAYGSMSKVTVGSVTTRYNSGSTGGNAPTTGNTRTYTFSIPPNSNVAVSFIWLKGVVTGYTSQTQENSWDIRIWNTIQ